MKTIGLIGYGDLGKQVKCLIEEDSKNKYDFIFFDDNLILSGSYRTFPFSYYKKITENIQYIVCLGYKHLNLKKNIITEIKKEGKKLFTFIHSTSYVSKSAFIGEGVVIYPGCNIDMYCKIKDGVLLNNSVTISHNSVIEKCCFLAPGVIISGNARVDECCFLGTNSVVADGLKIGKECLIGIGSVITNDIANKVKGIGNPFVKKNIQI